MRLSQGEGVKGNNDDDDSVKPMKEVIIGWKVGQQHLGPDRLVGLVVKASASGAEDPGFESCL